MATVGVKGLGSFNMHARAFTHQILHNEHYAYTGCINLQGTITMTTLQKLTAQFKACRA